MFKSRCFYKLIGALFTFLVVSCIYIQRRNAEESSVRNSSEYISFMQNADLWSSYFYTMLEKRTLPTSEPLLLEIIKRLCFSHEVDALNILLSDRDVNLNAPLPYQDRTLLQLLLVAGYDAWDDATILEILYQYQMRLENIGHNESLTSLAAKHGKFRCLRWLLAHQLPLPSPEEGREIKETLMKGKLGDPKIGEEDETTPFFFKHEILELLNLLD